MLFSVIIPTYNRAELLRIALDSVFAQTFTDYEVIVIDDGSTDGTWEELQPLGSRIHVLRQQNAGPGAARNLGVAQARGDYVAFLDSDDLWFPWTLLVFDILIQKNATPSILAAKVLEFRRDADTASVRDQMPDAEYYSDYYGSATKHYSIGVGMTIVRRDQFSKVGGFVEKRINAEDHDLIMRLGTAPGFVQVRSPYTLAYRRHVVSETNALLNSCEGVAYLLDQEENGIYPGGSARLKERWEILTLHVRPIALAALKTGLRRKAWGLYRRTVAWHLRQGRWKFLLGFSLVAAISLLWQGNHLGKNSQ